MNEVEKDARELLESVPNWEKKPYLKNALASHLLSYGHQPSAIDEVMRVLGFSNKEESDDE